MFCFGGCNLFCVCVCVLQLICARGRFPLRNAALSSGIAGLLLQPLSQQGEPDAGLGSPDKEKRIQHGWKGESVGLESGVRMGQMRSHTHKHAGTYVQTHTDTQSDAHVFYTHTLANTHTTHKSSPSSHWHMPRQLFTVTSNYICKKAPQDTTSLQHSYEMTHKHITTNTNNLT